jgi:PAS domain S-box-containing protein
MNTTSDGIALLDDHHTLLQINQSLCTMLGCYNNGHIGQSIEEKEVFNVLELSSDLKEKILNDEMEIYQDQVKMTGDGGIPAERTISPVFGPDDEVDGWLLVFRDLTKEIQLAEFREDLTRMLVHDLRSPVVSIQGGLDMIEVLIQDGKKKELLEMVDISRKGSVQVLGMINELLHLNRLESGNLMLQLDPVDIKSIFEEETIFLRSAIQFAKIEIKEEFERDLPFIQADTALMKRVIHNLIDNAIKFTPDEGVVTLWAKSDPEDEEKVLLGVKDNGHGIPEELLPEVFIKHFTIGGKSARRRGTGLGLYFSKLAVNAHGGEIWAESEVGKGTNILIRIPVNQ